jgi:phenylacetate-CoA ligase
MVGFYDKLECRSTDERIQSLMIALPQAVASALKQPGWRHHLGSIDPSQINTMEALSQLPVLRKSNLPSLQKSNPPFAGFIDPSLRGFDRLFTSPGPIFEPEAHGHDVWRAARALFAAGFRSGDIVLNTFSYHMVPGGFIMDSGARALGCKVIPAGPGQTDQQLDLIKHFNPVAYTGTPDFIKILIDKAQESGRGMLSLKKALVSGAAFPASLRDYLHIHGVEAFQAFATADIGVIAYETKAREGLVVNEDIIVEIVRPGTGIPVELGDVGEIVVTVPSAHHPIIRLALGDLSAFMPASSPCGRTNIRIKGWMGRADQTAKVRGLFVRPEQVADIAARHKDIRKMRLVIGRENEQDHLRLEAEYSENDSRLVESLKQSVKNFTQLSAVIMIKPPGSLPNDGKVIVDERPVE